MFFCQLSHTSVMEYIKPLQHSVLALKLKFLAEDDPVDRSFLSGTTWLDELAEDLDSEATLALLEGRDPEIAVEDYLTEEAEQCPACMCARKARKTSWKQ